MIPWWNKQVDPAAASGIAEAISRRRVGMGPLTEEFERRLAGWLGAPHVVAATSGSTALLLALMSCDVGPGDEVIVPAKTFVATAHAPLLLGASVRLVDVRPDRPLLDCGEALEAAINSRTKAILLVHCNGRAADVRRASGLAGPRGAAVIEDAAQAMGSRGANGPLGVQSDLGCFSMGVTKLITTGQGGFVATRRAQLDQRLRALRNHGSIETDCWSGREIGCNFKFPDLLAVVGLQELRRADASISRLKQIYSFYAEALDGLECIHLLEVDVAAGELPLWIEAISPQRETVLRLLEERSIGAKPFAPPLHRLPYLQEQGPFPNAERLADQGLTLPSGPALTDRQLRQVADALHEIDRILKRRGKSSRTTA